MDFLMSDLIRALCVGSVEWLRDSIFQTLPGAFSKWAQLFQGRTRCVMFTLIRTSPDWNHSEANFVNSTTMCLC
jgi:hypothetical protein